MIYRLNTRKFMFYLSGFLQELEHLQYRHGHTFSLAHFKQVHGSGKSNGSSSAPISGIKVLLVFSWYQKSRGLRLSDRLLGEFNQIYDWKYAH